MSENINNENSLPEATDETINEVAQEAPAVEVEPQKPSWNSAEEVSEPVVEEAVAEVAEVVEETPAEEVENNVISSPRRTRPNRQPSATSVEDNVIASSAKSEKRSKASKNDSEVKEEKVALYSAKNATWNGVGKVYRGYNIVSKTAAESWLTRPHIRLATPEEVAKEFNN